MAKIIIIFSGYNQRAVIAFIRTLEKTKVPYSIIAGSYNDPIFFTDYKSKVFSVRKKINLSISDILRCLKEVKNKFKNYEKLIIAPSTEGLNRFLLDNLEIFERADCQIPLVNKLLYEKISDKEKFSRICLENNILTPKELCNPKKIKKSFVAKPKQYLSKKGDTLSPIIIKSEKEKVAFLKNFNEDDFYFQEFISGRSFYLLYYFSKNGVIYKSSQENFIQQPGGKSIVAAQLSNIHLEPESIKYEKLFRKINFSGLVMVELKFFQGEKYMIEANPRFWGPSQLFVDSKANLFLPFLFDLGLISNKYLFKEDTSKKNKYFWFGGIMQAFFKKESCAYHNYKEKEYIRDFPSWFRSDVYHREDTLPLFKNELIDSI